MVITFVFYTIWRLNCLRLFFLGKLSDPLQGF